MSEKVLWEDCETCKCPKCKQKKCENYEDDRGDFHHYCKECSHQWVIEGPDS